MCQLPQQRSYAACFRDSWQTAISELLARHRIRSDRHCDLLSHSQVITPPQVIESAQNSVTAGKVSELALNTGKIFKFGNKPGILIRSATGELKAFSAVCTHLDCIVQYQPDKKQIWCACHNGQYNLSGQNVGGPPPRPLEEFVVNTRGEEIVVSKA